MHLLRKETIVVSALSLTAGLVLGLLWHSFVPRASQPTVFASRSADRVAQIQTLLASPGRIEGATEVISVGAGVDGVIAELRVKEGQRVKAGEVVALIDRADLHSELARAQAMAESARQSRTRLVRGSRNEEREEAEAETRAARAVLEQARNEYQRMQSLYEAEVIPAESRDRAQRDFDVAKANLQAAVKREERIKAGPLPEELLRADADIQAAEAQVKTILADLDKSIIRAPISGTILKTFMKPGETFSTLRADPILNIADTSRFKVRAEVDERDVRRVWVGQPVLISAEGINKVIEGTVASMTLQMGRKKVQTGDPSEKSDRDVLEVMIELPQMRESLLIGLRVTAQFLNENGSERP
jgi:ABC exporter DevB family membrane fusion protein